MSLRGHERVLQPPELINLPDNLVQVIHSALPLPEFLVNFERRKIADNFSLSLNHYHELGIPVEPTTGTELQKSVDVEVLFTQNIAGQNLISPLLLRDVLVSALSKSGNPTVKVRSEAHVIGLTWPKEGETFIDSHKRAELIRQSLLWYTDPTLVGRRRHFDLEPLVAVLTNQQIGHWVRGEEPILKPPVSYREGAPKIEELIELLRTTLEWAGLSKDYQLRTTTLNNREVEVMIVDRDGQLAPFEMMGIKHLNNGSKFTTEWVKNVVGIKCFEPAISETFRIETVRSLSHHFRASAQTDLGKVPNYNILSMTPNLLSIWHSAMAVGEPPIRVPEREKDLTNSTMQMAAIAEVVEPIESPPPPQALPKISSQVKEIRYLTFERSKPGIGAKPSWIVIEHHDGTTEHICLDFGSQREDYYYNSMFDPSIQLGMAPFKEILPSTAEIPQFYRLTLLLKSAEAAGAAFLEDVENNCDLIDLYLTLTTADFRRLLRGLDPSLGDLQIQDFLDNLEAIVQDDGKKNKVKHIAFLISHFHDDHTGFSALVGSHIPQVMATESAPWREHFFAKGSWMDEVSIRRQRETLLSPKDNHHYSPQQLLLQPYETRFIGRGNVSVTSLPCDHSIYGSTMFLIAVYDDFGLPIQKILYSGDYRFKDTGLTEKSVEFLEAIGGVDVVITETTNVRPDNGQKKTSSLVTKESLHANYDDLFTRRQGAPIICQIDPKDLGLIDLITQHAVEHGRQIIYGIKHSEPIELFRQHDAATALTPATTRHQRQTVEIFRQGLDTNHWLYQEQVRTEEYHPRPQFSESTKILEPQKLTLSRGERRIIQFHPDQMMRRPLLTRQRDILVFVRPTSPIAEEMANIAPYLGQAKANPAVSVVRAHYFTYQERDRDLARRDQEFCQKMNWEYLSDLVFVGQAIQPSPQPLYRMSGHPKAEDFFNFMDTLLELNPQMRIIPVHGQARQFVGQELQRRFGDQVEVRKKMDKGKFELRLY